MDDRSAERIAANEATFRDANERIQERARELDFDRPVPFLCECGEPTCRQILRLPLGAYEAVRAEGTRFFVVPGHETVSEPEVRVCERHEDYLVVEKTGVGGAVAEERDPRQARSRG